MYTGASACNADNACVPASTIDCADLQMVCTLDGCVECVTDMDCGPDPEGGCAHNVCAGSFCLTEFAPQASPCPQVGGSSCDGFGGCIAAKYVFVTSTPSGSALGGTMGADMKCNGIAAGASLGGEWISWTSDSSSQVLMRLMPMQIPYLLLDGTPVLSSGLSLLNAVAPLVHGIDLDESLGLQGGKPVWTGTKLGGLGDGSCGNWTGGNANQPTGIAGKAGATDSSWTQAQNLPCNAMAHLYCFQH
jgi:hypothetical protein